MIGVGTTLNERFTLEMELGQGGMGTVYRATDQLLGRNVAIKFVKDSGGGEEINQFHLEAQILARLVHDKIVRLYDFGESEGQTFLVMEEVDGPSFAKRWRDLRLDDRLRICGQVAEALDYAHFQGVIHRDVKPGNVLLTASDESKLSDFGLSVITSDPNDQSGTIRGTPLYMSPEQAEGHALDHRTDLYSVGVMLYECVTGTVPFVGHQMAVLAQHVSAAPTAPRFKNPEISSTLENLILSLLAKDPTKRPASGNLVALDLFEEAERARRLQRINPGLRRSDPRNPAPPARTVTFGERSAEQAPVDGSGPIDSASSTAAGARAAPSALGPRVDSHSAALSVPQDAPRSTVTRRAGAAGTNGHPIAREMLAKVLETPIVIAPEERYLCGHYLAYLLGGARRRGLFLRRPLEARNADRARLLLAMTWLAGVTPTDEAIQRAGVLLDERPDVRGALSPVVVMKYLASRDSLLKRRRFRQTRQKLQDASAYARKAMLDPKGQLNPGLMPRTLEDLAKIAPPREFLDAHRVSLWNRVTEIWREERDFRESVLRYTTQSDLLDAGSADLWPEVVYPLLVRAHLQRAWRPRHEALWDFVVGKVLHVPVPGVRLDRMMVVTIPREVVEQFDEDLVAFVFTPQVDEAEAGPSDIPARLKPQPIYVGGTIPRDEPIDDDEPRFKVKVPLAPPEPFLFTQNSLRNLWEGAMEARDNARGVGVLHRAIPVGRYELAVIPTSRSRSASSVRAVLQGMPEGKQIEFFTPSALAKPSSSPRVVAIWTYEDASMAVVHLDFQFKARYILWHAPDCQQFNFGYCEELKQRLSTLNLEVPDQLDRVLSEQ